MHLANPYLGQPQLPHLHSKKRRSVNPRLARRDLVVPPLHNPAQRQQRLLANQRLDDRLVRRISLGLLGSLNLRPVLLMWVLPRLPTQEQEDEETRSQRSQALNPQYSKLPLQLNQLTDLYLARADLANLPR